jgi:hypothetical protein
MISIHPNYELLEEIPAEEHLGEFETVILKLKSFSKFAHMLQTIKIHTKTLCLENRQLKLMSLRKVGHFVTGPHITKLKIKCRKLKFFEQN